MFDFYRKKASEENFDQIVTERKIGVAIFPYQLVDGAPLAYLLFIGIVETRMIILSPVVCGFDFDKHECRTIPHQQVNFRTVQFEIPFNSSKPRRSRKFRAIRSPIRPRRICAASFFIVAGPCFSVYTISQQTEICNVAV